MTTREETFYRGEYLAGFAEHLKAFNHWTRRRKGLRDVFRFKHSNFDRLEVTVVGGEGDFHSFSCDVTLKGPRKQIRKFMEDAEKMLKNDIHSRECVDKQFKKVKSYEGAMQRIEEEKIIDFTGHLLMRTEYGCRNPARDEVSIGYIRKSPSQLRGVISLKKPSEGEERLVAHEIKGTKFVWSGYGRKVSLREGGEGVEFYTLGLDEIVMEIIERIEDGRPVSIT